MLQIKTKKELERAVGEVRIGVCRDRVTRWRETGAAKVRFSHPQEAILINTGGGLAGGDRFAFDITASQDSRLAVTTQAAERVYRTLGLAAEVNVHIAVNDGSAVCWLPRETILFAHSLLSRTLTCHLAGNARFLCVESVVLGRQESGEEAENMRLNDRWRILRGGKLVHVEALRLDSDRTKSNATLAGARAFATLAYFGDDAPAQLDAVRSALGKQGGASCWDGKLVARILAGDSFKLRKALIPAIDALSDGCGLPRVWSL